MEFPPVVSLADIKKANAGPWVSVSYCAGSEWFIKQYGPKPITRHVYPTQGDAYKAKAQIDLCGCGGGCEEWHAVEKAWPHERVGHSYDVERRSYAKRGGAIPTIFLLPSERRTLHRKKRDPKDAPKLRFTILKRDGFRCRLCGVSARDGDHVRLEVDHITARANGGTDDPSNLWTLCFECNHGKGTQTL